MKTPQINDLIGWMKKKIVLQVRHAFWWNVLTQCAKWLREIFIFEVLSTTRARSSKSLTLCPLHENHSYQANESAVHLFCTTWSTWNNRRRLNLTWSSILMWRFRRSCRRSFLNSLAGYCPPVAVYASGLGQLLETVFKRSLLFFCCYTNKWPI